MTTKKNRTAATPGPSAPKTRRAEDGDGDEEGAAEDIKRRALERWENEGGVESGPDGPTPADDSARKTLSP